MSDSPDQADHTPASRLTRRSVLGAIGAGAAAFTAYELFDQDTAVPTRAPNRTGRNPLVAENALPGSDAYAVGADGTVSVNDTDRQIQGYASATSVGLGETIAFHVAVARPQEFDVAVYRFGHYGGAGARLMDRSPALAGQPCAVPEPDRDGTLSCGWPESWSLTIPSSWLSGIYLAVYTTADRHRSYSVFTVREPERGSDVLVIQPVTTYQAYNLWPMNGVHGKSLYEGYRDGERVGLVKRAYKVSFDRPYAEHGLPMLFELDESFARWAEEQQYDVTYATSTDLHEGRIDPRKYTIMVYSGHDEYWSSPMRAAVEAAYEAGTHQAFMAANNMYWRIRFEDSADGGANRIVTCFKESGPPDPDAAADPDGPTVRWRVLKGNGTLAEQGFLGVQFTGIPDTPTPLVVKSADHWVWEGTGLSDDDEIADLVNGEADGYEPGVISPKKVTQTLLSASRYHDRRGHRMQHTSLVVDDRGTMVFVGATFTWPLALYNKDHRNELVRRATRNLFERMLTPRE